MVTAALLSFGLIVVAWALAPDGRRREQKHQPATPEGAPATA